MQIFPSAVLLELTQGDRSVQNRQVDERPLSALLAAVLKEQPLLATDCFRLPGDQTFRDGTNKEPDVVGHGADGRVASLIEVKTGSNNFNWSSNRDQLTRYRETNDVGSYANRVLVLPASRAAKITRGIEEGGGGGNTPWIEISQNWRMVTWEEIAA